MEPYVGDKDKRTDTELLELLRARRKAAKGERSLKQKFGEAFDVVSMHWSSLYLTDNLLNFLSGLHSLRCFDASLQRDPP